LQANVIRQLTEETDPEKFRAREEAMVDGRDISSLIAPVPGSDAGGFQQ
jgi:hypothetical protein